MTITSNTLERVACGAQLRVGPLPRRVADDRSYPGVLPGGADGAGQDREA
ncbi:hypothetical protein GCM10017744_057650 [Streptomyces antimycoticus]|uniref:Uncharacterized protein n=1 Tax=Streptomyces antimycoticus TaxID=68175 RepID=A0A4D4KB64_9ACTN|nr:hypothetical protein SANT12839_044590 [Streptomyces antimycoticus]